MEISGVVIVILIAVLITLLFSFFLVRAYTDKRESSPLTTSVSTLAISVTLCCVLLIPVDIYIVSSSLNTDGTQKDVSLVHDTGEAIKNIYYTLYIILLVLAFGICPFAYFYFEEDDESRPISSRAWGAFKYTIGFIVFFAICLMCGLILKKGKSDDPNADWKDRMTNEFTGGEAILSFCIGVLSVLGLLFYILYVAYGLARLPFKLVASRGKAYRVGARGGESRPIRDSNNAAQMTEDELELALKRCNENISYLTSQYDLSARNWKESDKAKLRHYEAERKRLNTMRATKQHIRTSQNTWSNKCWSVCAPIRWMFGIPLGLISLLIIISLLISVIDKFQHSTCSYSCGYALDEPSYINPLDEFLRQCSKVFPIDFILFGGLTIYMFLAAVSGLISLGVRIVTWKLYSVVRRRTMPHAMVMASWMLMFVALVLNMQIVTLIPQYAVFGHQFYIDPKDGSEHACTVEQAGLVDNLCVMSQIGHFIHTMGVESPFLAVILFYANLVFIAFYLFFVATGLCSPAGDAAYQTLNDENAFDSE